MDESEALVAGCFSAVLPHLNPAEIIHANPNNVRGWDSIATVTLMAAIEQELGIEIEPADVEEFVSFESIVSFVRRRKAGTAST
jgi:acyl carrier protein